jgi:3-oxoacyl-[acyl-carrier protein] reductase
MAQQQTAADWPKIADLEGKRILITGASTGIGAAAARAFGANGARVGVHYNASRDKAEIVARDVEAAGGKAVLIGGDVTKSAEIKRIMAEAAAGLGGLDVLVNNAGGLVKRIPVTEYDDAIIDSIIDLNVRQVAHFMREGAGLLIAQGTGGSIINLSSVAARVGGGPGSVLYAAAKGFVSTATRGWARELVKHKIRVNAVSPGVIMTPFHERYSTPEQLATMQTGIPMDRLGSADECVGAFLYLASERLGSFVTGQILEVNGGQYMP